MNKTAIIIIGVLATGTAAYFILHKTVAQKRTYLKGFANSEKWDQMSDDEIKTSYAFVHGYAVQKKQLPQSSSLYPKVNAISIKYNIFT